MSKKAENDESSKIVAMTMVKEEGTNGTRELRCSVVFHKSTEGQLVGGQGGREKKAGSHNLSDSKQGAKCATKKRVSSLRVSRKST